jgi:predicted nucleic acid-binding protein
VALAWYFEDESSEYADLVLAHIRTDGALVPAVWPLEIANSLIVAERRKRLSSSSVERGLGIMSDLPITIATNTIEDAFGSCVSLARSHDLSAYDATYLTLAVTHDLPLATEDRKLRRVATRIGVPLFDSGQ